MDLPEMAQGEWQQKAMPSHCKFAEGDTHFVEAPFLPSSALCCQFVPWFLR